MSKNQPVNRRKPRPESQDPGMFTGKKPNFMSRALAKPVNLLGNLALTPKNTMERRDPANMGNDPFGQNWYGKTGFHSETPVEGGMAPVTTMITPRPTHHYFDLLGGGKKEHHMIQLEQEIDLKNIRPEQGAEAMAKMEQKAKNDEKISNAVQPLNKEAMQATMGPSSYRPAYYDPYPKAL